MKNGKLNGKVAVVTAASTKIGAGIASDKQTTSRLPQSSLLRNKKRS
jgi:hypothetical protein